MFQDSNNQKFLINKIEALFKAHGISMSILSTVFRTLNQCALKIPPGRKERFNRLDLGNGQKTYPVLL